MANKPAKIHPTLCEANKLLLICNNLKVSSNEAVALWSLFEDIDHEFAGIGQIDTSATIDPAEIKLWAQRGLYFWCLNGAVGEAGLPAEELSLTDRAQLHASAGAVYDDDDDDDDGEYDDEEDLDAPELALEDFWCRLYCICTLFDRTRQLKFVFRQLQHDMGVAKVRQFGHDVVHKKELVAMVATLHGEYAGPKELEKMLSYVTFDERDCLDLSAFTRLNMIVKTLLKPLDKLRRLLRKRWLGERFWARQDRIREDFEAENLMGMSELLRSGHFTTRRFDFANGGEAPKMPTSLKAIREALAAQREKAKKEAKNRPETPVPVGERKGTWWREVSLVRQKKKKKKNQGSRSRDAGPSSSSSSSPSAMSDADRLEALHLAKDVVEHSTADVLVRIKDAKKKAKDVLAKSREEYW